VTDPSTTRLGAAATLGRAAHLVARRIEDAVRPPHGPGLDAWRVLDLLADDEGHPMSEIAAHAMVPAPTLTKIVDRLVDRGFVYRRPDGVDRRRVLVQLAERGRELHLSLSPAVRAVEDDVRSALGPDADAVLAALDRLA
jgi:DNA-binding MarR family transcriptional regulator